MKYKIIAFLIMIMLTLPAFSCRSLFLGGCEYNSTNQAYKSFILYLSGSGNNPKMYPASSTGGITTVTVFKPIAVLPTIAYRLILVNNYNYLDGISQLNSVGLENDDSTPANTPLSSNLTPLGGTSEPVGITGVLPADVYDDEWHTMVTVLYESASTWYLKCYFDGDLIDTVTLTGDYTFDSSTATTKDIYFQIGYHNKYTFALYANFNGIPTDNEIKSFNTSKNIYTFVSYNPFVFSIYDQTPEVFVDNDEWPNSKLSESISDIGDFGYAETTVYSLSTGINIIRDDPGIRFTKKRKK